MEDARLEWAIFSLEQRPKGLVVDRMKVLRLIENIVLGAGAVAYLIESVHGAGSPMAQRIMISRQGEIEGKIKRVKSLLNIS